MKAGDLVKTDPWLPEAGKIGIVIKVYEYKISNMIAVYALFKDIGVKLFRVENLQVIK